MEMNKIFIVFSITKITIEFNNLFLLCCMHLFGHNEQCKSEKLCLCMYLNKCRVQQGILIYVQFFMNCFTCYFHKVNSSCASLSVYINCFQADYAIMEFTIAVIH
jgi:hypothetical protein